MFKRYASLKRAANIDKKTYIRFLFSIFVRNFCKSIVNGRYNIRTNHDVETESHCKLEHYGIWHTIR